MADEVREVASERLDEDEPVRLEPHLPPEIASPLAPFAGEKPPSPPWFKNALDRAPQRRFVDVSGAKIELLTWGEVGRPGLIFVHGNSAHADWWSFIAPFFAEDYRVAAISFSGMGGSDWRDAYSFDVFAEEMFECGRAAGLYEAAQPPIYIGHSFGGAQVMYSAVLHRERMRAAILVDTGFGGPPTPEQMEAWRRQEEAAGRPVPAWAGRAQRTRPNRVYATLPEALARFRFMPPQVPGNLFLADHIARASLKRAPLEDGSGEGWTWRFDPFFWQKIDRSAMNALVIENAAPMIHIYGDRSDIIRRHSFQEARRIPASVPQIVIPDSEHHVMVDQPLALVAAMRAALALWPPRGLWAG